jgi:ribulose-phosphate 3-epimerase
MRPLLEVDGGIDVANVAEVTAAGADVLVSGSGIYGGDDPAESTRALRAAAGKRRPR